jgi:asparagine synthase (glutamine-hydrolysing)
MCGIFGIVHRRRAADPAEVDRLTDAVSHRGPDGRGRFLHENVGLGHRRLAILDLSERGAQPMHHPQRAVSIVHNGEVYNHVELRRELEALGHTFRGQSDTEVILAAWIQWGRECLARFNGMWSFVVFDRDRHEVFCARDRFGVKPLYWTDTGDSVAFGSEIRQLRPLIAQARATSGLVRDFLATGLSDHTQDTFLEGIRQVPGGHWLSIDTRNGQCTQQRWYRLEPATGASMLGAAAAAESLAALLADAVTLRLRSDVPVGTCLSGGLDSSSIATLAAPPYQQSSGQPFRAITAVSSELANNEEGYARQVADSAGLQWITVRPTFADFEAALDGVVAGQEEPFAGPSIFMQYFVMQEARRQGVTVLLDGQGGDETLLGYERYYGAWLLDALREGGVAGIAGALRSIGRANDNMPPLRATAYVLGSLFAPLRAGAVRWRYPYLRDARLPEPLRRFGQSTRDARAMQAHELTCTNLPMLLRYEDKNSMQHGIETRLPFLDYRLVEFALGLRSTVKMHDGWTKWPLRKAMSGRMPEAITWRRNKIGFEAPAASWLGEMMPRIREAVLSSRFLEPYVDLRRLRDRFHTVDHRMLWRLYNTELWARNVGAA